MAREAKTVYFDTTGSTNTEETLKLAKARAEELGIKTILVASTTGNVGVKAAEEFKGHKAIVVVHTTGFTVPDTQELIPENKEKIEKLGACILIGTHSFGGIARAIRRTFKTYTTGEFMAHALRIFGDGAKVAIEITLMAADAGLVRTDEEVIAIGGTATGADTALVIKPANTHDLFNLRVKEIICKPRF